MLPAGMHYACEYHHHSIDSSTAPTTLNECRLNCMSALARIASVGQWLMHRGWSTA
jgi:hypothetical protein